MAMAPIPTLNPITPQQPQTANLTTPSYLQPQSGGGLPGNISNMVKAIMAGNAEHKMQQQKQSSLMGQSPFPPVSSSAPGMASAPLPTPVDPSSMTGGAGSAPAPAPLPQMPMGGSAPVPGLMAGMGGGGMPGMPNGADPTMAALFSQIPGQGNQ